MSYIVVVTFAGTLGLNVWRLHRVCPAFVDHLTMVNLK